MRMSARLLGLMIGLTAQEMNRLLEAQGFLAGSPGVYSVTEKGAPFALEKLESRGTGGYLHYNPSWTTRSWNEEILDVLDLSDGQLRAARDAVASARRAAAVARRALSESAAEVVRDVRSSRGSASPRFEGWAGKALGTTAAVAGLAIAIPVSGYLWKQKAMPAIRARRARRIASQGDPTLGGTALEAHDAKMQAEASDLDADGTET